MHLICHPARLNDLPACLACSRDLFACDPQERGQLLDMWRALFRSSAGAFWVFEDLDRPAGRGVAYFCLIVFLTDSFAEYVRATAAPCFALQALRRWRAGAPPFLDLDSIRRANTDGGLVMACLQSGAPEEYLAGEAGREVRDLIAESMALVCGGYRLREFFIESYSPASQAWQENAGFRVCNDYAAYYAACDPPPGQRACLNVATRQQTRAGEGTVVASVFNHRPPRFGFTDGEQELLRWALTGLTDEELAAELSLAVISVSKRWSRIYERVLDVAPGLFPPEATAGGQKRGPEKRRRLLHYLRRHPEELRPAILTPEPAVGNRRKDRGRPANAPPSPRLGPRHNLPPQGTSFVGREREVGEVRALLATRRLLTLTGAGGAGKTRLALRTASSLLEEFPGGLWLVELAPLADAALVPQAVVQALGVREEAGTPLSRTLAAWIGDNRLLLILDNCEHLTDACAALAAELRCACPHLHILATSREPLRVAGEQVYPVPGLSLPDTRRPTTPQTLSEVESVRLFVERTRLVRPDFAVMDANAPAVAQVCWRLDGLPLAIEMAAARVRAMAVEEVMAGLDDRFRLLTGGSRSAPPRHQTLRALIDWSYELLNEPEKILLRRLSVFAGGCILEAAERVCAGTGVAGWEVLDLLTSLVDKSLVIFEDQSSGTGRYRLLETVRQYGAERLEESGEAEEVRRRHTLFYLALAEEAAPHLTGYDPVAWLTHLDAEHENLRAALEWCLGDGGDTEAALRLCSSLVEFWHRRGYLTEARQWLGRALARLTDAPPEARAGALSEAARAACEQSDYQAARGLYEQALSIQRERGDAHGIADNSDALGWTLYNLGDLAAARALFEQCLALGRERQEPRIVLQALTSLGDWEEDRNEHAAARALYQEALEVANELGVGQATITALRGLARIDFNDGRYDESRTRTEEVLLRQRALGHTAGVAESLRALGDVARAQRDGPAAHAFYEESRAIYRALDNEVGVGGTLNSQGLMAAQEGDYARAIALYEQWLAIHEERGDRAGAAFALDHMGEFAQDRGDYPAARLYFERCLSIRRGIGHRGRVEAVLLSLGHAAERLGFPADARQPLTECLGIWRDLGDEPQISLVLANLGNAAIADGDLRAARVAFEESLAIRRGLPKEGDIAFSLTDMGNLALREGRREEASDLYRQALAIWRAGGGRGGAAFTMAGVARLATEAGLAERAVRLLGAVNGLVENVSARWPFYMREDYECDM
ncbi:MAG: tetratricopeptide repeat protein, partial [Armatimonadetes bacterium]|nr:tetratricopeptide repeat protein [Armatimonadota bacterium]